MRGGGVGGRRGEGGGPDYEFQKTPYTKTRKVNHLPRIEPALHHWRHAHSFFALFPHQLRLRCKLTKHKSNSHTKTKRDILL